LHFKKEKPIAFGEIPERRALHLENAKMPGCFCPAFLMDCRNHHRRSSSFVSLASR